MQATQDDLQLDKQVCFRLYTASRLITQAYEPFLKEIGITYTQYLVLLLLWEKDQIPINELVKRLYLGINTISPLIKRLEKLELISRKENPKDKRQQILSLTPKGKKIKKKAAKIPGCLAEVSQSCGIEPEAISTLSTILDDYIERMSKHLNQ